MSSVRFLAVVALLVSVCTAADAQVVYTEVADGELSGDSTTPTDLGILLPGSNTVTGQVTAIGDGGFNGTADVFTFEIGAGEQLDSIVLDSFSTTSGSAVFIALDDGPTFGFTAEEINDQFLLPDLTQIMGGTIAGTANVGTDVLDDLQNAVNFGNGSAFTTPLTTGQYSFYIQETSPSSDYTFAFNVSSAAAVPEPSTFAALGVMGLAFAWRQRRRKNAPKA